jgi:hypothetical protein
MAKLLDAEGNELESTNETPQEKITEERFHELTKLAQDLYQQPFINSCVAVHGILHRVDAIVSAFLDNALKEQCKDLPEQEAQIVQYSLGSYSSFISSSIASGRELLSYMLTTIVPFCNIICKNEDEGFVKFDTSFKERVEKAAGAAQKAAEEKQTKEECSDDQESQDGQPSPESE